MSRIPVRARTITTTSSGSSFDDSTLMTHPSRIIGVQHNVPTESDYEPELEISQVDIEPFQDFNVLDYSTNSDLEAHILHAIPEEPFAYANLLEHSAANLRSESRVRDRFRDMVRGSYEFHLRIRETTQLTALPRRMEMVFDREDNLKYTRFTSPPGVAAIVGDNGQFRTFRGNRQYIAPEVTQGRIYAAHQVDIWVLGVMLYVMLVGSFPFSAPTDRKLFRRMSKGAYTIPEYISASAQDLIHRMLNPDPLDRASFDFILMHPWLELTTPILLSPSLADSSVGTPPPHQKTNHHPFTNLKSLFLRHKAASSVTHLPITSPPRTPSPPLQSANPSTDSLQSSAQSPANSTSTLASNASTRPTTISSTSTATSIAASIKSALKWLLDGPHPPPQKLQRRGDARYSPYSAKQSRSSDTLRSTEPDTRDPRSEEAMEIDGERSSARPGGEGKDWRYWIMREVVKTSIVKEKDAAKGDGSRTRRI